MIAKRIGAGSVRACVLRVLRALTGGAPDDARFTP
jgi:hypothetical protein